MKLLIVTQKVDIDDPILGFFHRWIIEFAKHCESVVVICLQHGRSDLPKNVKVLSLGKEVGQPRFEYVLKFYTYLWHEKKSYEAVFVHMNPIYLVLAGWWWRLTGKRTALWYVHKSLNSVLKVGAFWAEVIFTATPETFPINSDKVVALGHGIDVASFLCAKVAPRDGPAPLILQVGRISIVKRVDLLVQAAKILSDRGVEFTVLFVGGPTTSADQMYFADLKNMVSQLGLSDRITFAGPVANHELAKYYCRATVAANPSITGGIDKVVLEAMAAGVPTVVASQSFRSIFASYSNLLIMPTDDAFGLAGSLEKIFWLPAVDRESLADFLSLTARNNFSVESLIGKVVRRLEMC